MLVERKGSFYRPYYVKASGREYKLEKIHFYKDDKILVTVNNGWLQKESGGDITTLELPVEEIKARRKETFDGKVFVISQGREYYGNDLIAELYIPVEMLDVQFVENIIEYKTQVRAIYKGSQDIYISVYVKFIDDKLKDIRNQYEEIYTACDGYNLGYHTDKIIKNLDKLKALAEEYVKEKERVESLTIDDIEL